MPDNRPLTLPAALRTLLATLLMVQGCDQGNYSPGSGRDDISYFVLVGEPTGDSLKHMLGLDLSWEAESRWSGEVLGSLDQLGVRTLAYAPVTPADGSTEADPNLRGIIDSGMRVILEFPLSTPGSPDDGYPHLSQTIRHCIEIVDSCGGTAGVSILITSPDADLQDVDSLSVSANRLAEAVHALSSEFPSLSVGAGGWTLEGDRSGIVASAMIGALAGSSTGPDFVSFRLSRGVPSVITPAVSELRRLLQEQGLGETELVLSGWTPEGADGPGSPPSPATVAACWIDLQSAGLADAFLAPGPGWDLLPDGTPSPLLGTFTLFSRCADHPSRLAAAVTMNGDQWGEPDDIERLWVLAGEDSSGQVAVLLANMTSDTAMVEMTYLVPSLAAGFRFDVVRVGKSSGGTVRTGQEELSVEIVPQEALLVVAAPI